MQHWVKNVFEDLLWAASGNSEEIHTTVSRIVRAIEGRDVYLFRTEELESIADGLVECVDLNDLSSWMWKATTSLHFQNFAIFVLKPGPGTSFHPKICTSYNTDWIDRYVEKTYQFVDPVMRRAAEADGCFAYSELDQTSPLVEKFWQDAERHRIGRNGHCCAFTRPDGTRIGVAFSSRESQEKVQEIVRKFSSDLFSISQLAGEAFCYAVAGPTIQDCCLSELELRCLYILATSSSPEDASKVASFFGPKDSLEISIRRKLRVQNVFQAIAIAASKGWFNSLPYETGEIVSSLTPLQNTPKG
ncbi:MAG: autoinducer binding domain-containing protein [Pseudomonadota bacterium]